MYSCSGNDKVASSDCGLSFITDQVRGDLEVLWSGNGAWIIGANVKQSKYYHDVRCFQNCVVSVAVHHPSYHSFLHIIILLDPAFPFRY